MKSSKNVTDAGKFIRVRVTPELKEALMASMARSRRSEPEEIRVLLELQLGLLRQEDLLPITFPQKPQDHGKGTRKTKHSSAS